MTILNLPRNLRYRAEFFLLCGIIPGPKEPKDLIVQELLLLWEGVTMSIEGCGLENVRAALICITSDLPAIRKVCGFAGHSACFGCFKCFKKFKSVGDKLDYLGFLRENWKLRDLEGHKARMTNFFKLPVHQKHYLLWHFVWYIVDMCIEFHDYK